MTVMLEAVATEAAKVVTASISGVLLSGARQVVTTLAARFKPSFLALGQDELREMILAECRRDPQFAAAVAKDLVTAAPGAAPRVTVVAPAGFVDRDEVRSMITEPGTWLIAGGHGAGKTTVVQQIAAERAEQYPDGQFLVKLDDFRDGGSLLITEVQRFVLRCLGIDILEAAVPDVDNQYLVALMSRRFILMIDNVRDRTEAEALARRWPESLVLVTTRHLSSSLRSWARPGLIQLPGLDKSSALELLAACSDPEILAAEPAPAQELLRRCDWIPLAIEYSGVEIMNRAGEKDPVAAILREMGSAADDNELLQQCVARSFRRLSGPAQRGAMLLSSHPDAEFSRAAAVAILGEPAGSVLTELVDASLLSRSPVGRFQVHRLVRRYLAVEAGTVDIDAAFVRVLTFYRDRAVAADLAQGVRLRRYSCAGFAPWPDPGVEPIQWLDTEAETILELVTQAGERGFHAEVLQLCGPLEVLLTNRGRHTLCAAANEVGIRSATLLADRVVLARLHAMQLRIFTILHLVDRAAGELARAHAALAGIDDPQMASSLLEFEARLHEERAETTAAPDYATAIDCLAASVGIDRSTEAAPRVGLGLHLRMLANLLVKAGRPAEALALLDEAGAHTVTGRNAARIDTVAAKAYAALGQLPQARKHLDRAIALGAQAGATQYAAELKEIEAGIAVRSGDFETAAAALRWLAQLHLENSTQRAQHYLDQLTALPSWSRA